MKIALAQINTTVGDFAGNGARILQFAERAHARGADLVAYPELALCGYPPRDLVERPDFVARCEQAMENLAQRMPDIPALVGYVRRSHACAGKAVADSAALLHQGRIALVYDKILLAFYDVFDESRYFEPGKAQAVYDLAGYRLGITICEDAWNDKNFWRHQLYPRDPVEETIRAGAEIILNIASSPYSTEKIRMRHDMLKAIADERRVPVVYVNQVGGNDQLVFDGSSMAFDGRGQLCARAESFEEDLVLFDTADGTKEIHPAPLSEVAAVYEALLLGTRDYVHKCGFRETIVGLSGGIDSSLVATIAADALGPKNVCGVSMPGPYSSPGSISDAEALAHNLGIEFRSIPIGAIFKKYLDTLAPSFRGRAPDVTEENLQARIRGNLLMALSNKFGALVLSTGNKSELAVGYCTLYGDMAGGLAVVGDVPKTMVYALASHVNRNEIRIPAAIIDKPPSAELRLNQTDQDTLPPYPALDAVLRAYIEENLCAEQIIEKYGLDPQMVRRAIGLVDRAEYKRQQAAPALKVTAKAFGIGRRFPIASRFSG